MRLGQMIECCLRCGPDEVSSHHAGEAVAHGLGGHDKQDLESPVEELAVVHFLREQDVDGVAGGGPGSCHDALSGQKCQQQCFSFFPPLR